jgi:alpha-beta hydrolase superfamily lysophospholipase
MSLFEGLTGFLLRRFAARPGRGALAAPPATADFDAWLAGWGALWGVTDLRARVRITFSRRLTRSFGRCTPRTGSIRLNPALLRAGPGVLREVVCHEAAHAAAWVLHGGTARAHGREWKELMRRAGYEPRARWKDAKASAVFALAALALTSFGCVRIVHEQDLLPGAQMHPPAPAKPPDLEVAAADGSTLRGQAFTGPGRKFAVVYFGGNGEIVTADSGLGEIARAHDLDLYAVNYRGFGPSAGTASLEAIATDSLRVFDAVAARPDVRGLPIVVYGYSIGALAALNVATNRPVAGVVLQGAPSSAKEVIPEMRRALPWYVRGAVRLRAAPDLAASKPQPIDLAPKLTAPLLSIHGTKDVVVAVKFGREVFDAAGSAKKTWCGIDGGEHMGLWTSFRAKADACLEKFLGEVGK